MNGRNIVHFIQRVPTLNVMRSNFRLETVFIERNRWISSRNVGPKWRHRSPATTRPSGSTWMATQKSSALIEAQEQTKPTAGSRSTRSAAPKFKRKRTKKKKFKQKNCAEQWTAQPTTTTTQRRSLRAVGLWRKSWKMKTSDNTKSRRHFLAAWRRADRRKWRYCFPPTKNLKKNRTAAYLTMLGCSYFSICLSREISRKVDMGTPSSVSGTRTFLSATIWPALAVSRALYTVPYAPVAFQGQNQWPLFSNSQIHLQTPTDESLWSIS